jgi:sugar phosphate isomerase/epimerase
MSSVHDVPSGRLSDVPTPEPGDPRLARLSLNQETVKSWSVPELVGACVRAGVPAVGLWREPVAELGLAEAAKLVRSAGLRVSSLCRAGFLTSLDGDTFAAALAQTHAAIDESAQLEAACLPVIAGGLGEDERDGAAALSRFTAALDRLVPHAQAEGVRLAVEPLHPMQYADRSVVCTLAQAADLVADYPSEVVGVVVDTYNVWWDPALRASLLRLGDRIASYQVNDWVLPLAAEIRLSRGMMGDGHIDLPVVGRWVADAGYQGDVEVEIFNQQVWDAPPEDVLGTVRRRYVSTVLPADEAAST